MEKVFTAGLLSLQVTLSSGVWEKTFESHLSFKFKNKWDSDLNIEMRWISESSYIVALFRDLLRGVKGGGPT